MACTLVQVFSRHCVALQESGLAVFEEENAVDARFAATEVKEIRCSHEMRRMGPCDDFCCGDGEICMCIKCRVWFCEGVCGRAGIGSPPLLQH